MYRHMHPDLLLQCMLKFCLLVRQDLKQQPAITGTMNECQCTTMLPTPIQATCSEIRDVYVSAKSAFRVFLQTPLCTTIYILEGHSSLPGFRSLQYILQYK